MSLRVEVLNDMDILSLTGWRDLHRAAGGGPYSSIEWIGAWHAAYGDAAAKPTFCVAWRDGRMVAALSVGVRKGPIARLGPRMNTLGMLCQPRAGFHDVLVAPGHEDAVGPLLEVLLDHGDWDLIDLHPVSASPALVAMLQAARSHGLVCRERNEITASTCDLSIGWDAYLRDRGSSFNKQMKQALSRLKRQPHEVIKAHRPGPDGDRVLEQALTLSRQSWKARAGTDIGTEETTIMFLRELWQRLSERGAISVHLLMVNGKPAASNIVLDEGTTAYGWITDFDEAFNKLSPGFYLAIRTIEDAAKRGMTRFNMLRNTPFTQRFGEETETYSRVRLCRRFSIPNMLLSTEDLLRPIGKQARKRRQLRTRKRIAFLDHPTAKEAAIHEKNPHQ